MRSTAPLSSIAMWISKVCKEPGTWYCHYCAFWNSSFSSSRDKLIKEEKQTPWRGNSACLSLKASRAIPICGHCPDSHAEVAETSHSFLVHLRKPHVTSGLSLSTRAWNKEALGTGRRGTLCVHVPVSQKGEAQFSKHWHQNRRFFLLWKPSQSQ